MWYRYRTNSQRRRDEYRARIQDGRNVGRNISARKIPGDSPAHRRRQAGLAALEGVSQDGPRRRPNADANRATGTPALVATHRYCFGEVHRHPCSEDNDLLSCHRCHLSTVIPRTIGTYDSLDAYFRRALQRVDDFRAQVGALAASKPVHEA
jgi:hypothetical protein